MTAVEAERRERVVEEGEGRDATEQALCADGECFAVGADTVCVVFLHRVFVDFLYLAEILDSSEDIADRCRVDLLKEWDDLQSDLVSSELMAKVGGICDVGDMFFVQIVDDVLA